MNIGSVEASFDIKGLKESLDQLTKVTTELGRLDTSLGGSKAELKSYANSLDNVNSSIKTIISNSKNAASALTNISTKKFNESLELSKQKLSALSQSYKELKDSPGTFAGQRTTGVNNLARLASTELDIKEQGKLGDKYTKLLGLGSALSDFSKKANQSDVAIQDFLSRLRSIDPVNKIVLGSTTNLQDALGKTVSALVTLGTKYRDTEGALNRFKAAQDATNVSMSESNALANASKAAMVQRIADMRLQNQAGSGFNQMSKRVIPLGGQSSAYTPLNNFQIAISKLSTAPAVAKIKSLGDSFSHLSTSLQENDGILTSWYQHFGRIAAGYAVAYAAIRAVQSAFMGVFNVFKDGVKTLDDIRSSGATVAGMLAFLDKSAGGFAKNFEKHFEGSQQVLQRAMVLLPKYSLTLEQFNAGQRELAQFGVKVTGNNIEKTIITLKTLQEIAANTPGDVRQIRQELQALFTGAKPRPSDQFLKFIQTSAPDLFATFAKMRKEGKTTQEMFEALTDRMKILGPAMQQGAKTVETQFLILKKSISVISAKAQDTSGIYDTWLNKLMAFNQSLFTTEGGLTSFGTKIYDAFYRSWQVVDLLISGISILVKTAKVFVETIWKVFTSNFGQAFLKTVVSIYTTFAATAIIIGDIALSLIGLGNTSGIGKLVGALVGLYTVVTLSAFSWGLLSIQLKKFAGTKLVTSVVSSITMLYTAFTTGGIAALASTVGAMAVSFGVLAGQMLVAVGAGLALGGILVAIGTDLKNILTGVDDPLAGRRAFKAYFDEIRLMATDTSEYLKSIVGGTTLGEALIPDTKDVITKFKALTEEIQHEILRAAKAGDDDLVNQLLGLGGKDKEPKEPKPKKFKFAGEEAGVTWVEGFKTNAYAGLEDFFTSSELEAFIFDKTKQINVTNFGEMKTDWGTVTIQYSEQVTESLSSQLEYWQNLRLEMSKYFEDLDIQAVRDAAMEKWRAKGSVGDYFNMPLSPTEMKEAIDLTLAEQKRLSTNWDFELRKMQLGFDSFGSYLGSSFSGLFSSVFNHEITSFAQFFQGALKSIQQSFSDMLSEMVSEYFTAMMKMQFKDNAVGLMSKMFTGGSVAGDTSLPSSVSPALSLPTAMNQNYAGGMINEPVWGVGKSGATYSFAEKGPERVLSNSDSKAYAKGASAPATVINFINESGTPLSATQSAPQFDGEKYITSIIVKQMATSPSFRSSMRG